MSKRGLAVLLGTSYRRAAIGYRARRASKRWPFVVLGTLLLLLNPSATPGIRADSLQLWGFSASGDTGGFRGQPSNGATNQVSWVPQPSVAGGGALRLDYTGSNGFNTSIKTTAPSLPWNVTTITADVYVPSQVRLARLGLGIQIDGPPASKLDVPVHLLNTRGGWNHMSWPLHPGQISAPGHTFGFVLDTDEPMTGPIYVDDIRGVPASISVDAGHVISSFDPVALWGNNIAYYYPRAFLNDPIPAQLARDAGFYFFRIPGGLNSDVYHWNGNGIRNPDGSVNPAARRPDGTWQIDYSGWAPGFEVKGESPTGDPLSTSQPDFGSVNAYDHSPAVDVQQLAHWILGLGPQAQMMVDVNVGTGSRLVATGPGNTLQESDVAVGAREAAEWVRFFNQRLGYHVLYWEIGNELNPFGAEIGTHIQDSSPQGWHWITAADYAAIFRAYARAMKAVDPAIKLCGPVDYVNSPADGTGTGNWIQSFLQLAGDWVDVLDIHFYDSGRSESEYLSVPSNLETQVDALRGWIRQYAPRRAGQIGIGVSEWGDYNNRYPIGDGLFSADLMGRMATDQLTFGNAWDMGNIIPNNGRLVPTLGFDASSQYAGGWTADPGNGATNALSWTDDPAVTRPGTSSLAVDYTGSTGQNAHLSRDVGGVDWSHADSLRVDVFVPPVAGNDAITFWLRIEHADGSVDDSYHDQLQQPIWGQWNRLLFPIDAAKLANARRLDLVVNSPTPIATPLYFSSLETQRTQYQPNGRYWAAYMYHHFFSNTLVYSTIGDTSRDRLAAYASRAPDGSLYLMVVNKDPLSDVGIPITITNYSAAPTAEAHTWSADNYVWDPSQGVATKDTPPSVKIIAAGSQFSYVFPRYSITSIKLTPG